MINTLIKLPINHNKHFLNTYSIQPTKFNNQRIPITLKSSSLESYYIHSVVFQFHHKIHVLLKKYILACQIYFQKSVASLRIQGLGINIELQLHLQEHMQPRS